MFIYKLIGMTVLIVGLTILYNHIVFNRKDEVLSKYLKQEKERMREENYE